jgi:hypothetical protein
MAKPSRKFEDYCYFILDVDQKQFNCFVLNMPRVNWDTKLNEAIESGKNVQQQYFEKEKLEEYKQKYINSGYQYTDSLLIDEPYNDQNEYKKKLPKYAEGANLNRILVIYHDGCSSTLGELTEYDYPGNQELKDNPDKYEVRCLKCGKILDGVYNFYR